MNRPQPEITRDEIERALARFRQAGGLINRLPDQVAPVSRRVGGKWAAYEPVWDEGAPPTPAP